MTLLQAAALGVVEGLTEFLPVSSTGHLILVSGLLAVPQTEFLKTFNISIQLGAIAAVVVMHWRSFLDRAVLQRVIVGFLPTGIIGLALYKVVKRYLLDSDLTVVIALAVGGVALIAFERWYARVPGSFVATKVPGTSTASADATALAAITYRQAAVIGICQALAVIPGVSRSAATIVGGLAQGIQRETIVRFSFLLAVPVMLAATGLDLLQNAGSFSSADAAALAVGMIVSFIVALAAISFFLQYVRTRTFTAFGVYRIAVALLFAFLLYGGPVVQVESEPTVPVAPATNAAPSSAETTTTVVAVGDVMLSRSVDAVMKSKQDVHFPYVYTRDITASADIAFANLETPVTPGRPVGVDELTFRADPSAVDGLAAAGFDVVSLANNHTPNFGEPGLLDTFAYLEAAGIAYAGAGMNAGAANAPVILERNGTRFALLAYNDADTVPPEYFAGDDRIGTARMDAAIMTEAVRAVRDAADVVIVSMHAGNEYEFTPNERQTAFARAAVDAGADVVLGHHSHVVQTAERYGDGLIFYGLGNFIFDQTFSLATRQGVMARLTFEGATMTKAEVIPVIIEEASQPRIATGGRAADTLARLGLPLTAQENGVMALNL